LYTWDARTGKLARISSMGGLELARHIIAPGVWLKNHVLSFWNDYIALTDTAAENIRLREELGYMRQERAGLREDLKELERLQALLGIPPTPLWEQTGARVVAGRFGPQAVLNSVMIDKGFVGGALPGAPVVTRQGLVGKIYHAAPNSSNVLLLNDPSFRVAVMGQESRVRGILAGTGAGQHLEVLYVAPNTNMKQGEILICSGLDRGAPKGVPAAQVSTVFYDKDTLFPYVTARPLALLDSLEEIVVLVPPRGQKAEDLVFPFDAELDSGGETVPGGGITDEEAAKIIGN
jgi:rod shape-determining protein MreC